MASLRRLRDLISLSRDQPIYTNPPDVYPNLSGPAGDEAQRLGLGDSVDFSAPVDNPAGPVQVGSQRVNTPFGARLKAAIPDMISSGITAAAHQNTAGGGPVDFFGALADVGHERERKQLQRAALNRQASQDAIANRKATVDEQNLQRQIARDEATAANNRDTQTRMAGVAETQAGAAFSKEVNEAVRQGARIITPQAVAGLDPESRARVVTVKGTNLLYPSEQEQFQKGRIKVKVPQALQDLGLPAEHWIKPEEADSWLTAATKAMDTKGKKISWHFEKNDSGGLTAIAVPQEVTEGETPAPLGTTNLGPLGTTKPPPANAPGTARSDRSYQFNVGELNKIGKPIEDRSERMSRLMDTIKQMTPQADALIAPELMTVMAGGQGSGVRLTKAEIDATVGGRSNWEALKASLNKWQLDPTKALSVTPAQRKQMRDLISVVNKKVQEKHKILNDAHEALLNSDDPQVHRRIVADARRAFSDVDQAGNEAPDSPGTVEEWVRDASGNLVKKAVTK